MACTIFTYTPLFLVRLHWDDWIFALKVPSAASGKIINPNSTEASFIVNKMVCFSNFDVQNYEPEVKLLEKITCFLSDKIIIKMQQFWCGVLLNFFLYFCGCQRPSSRSLPDASHLISLLDGYDLSDDLSYTEQFHCVHKKNRYSNESSPTSSTGKDIKESP